MHDSSCSEIVLNRYVCVGKHIRTVNYVQLRSPDDSNISNVTKTDFLVSLSQLEKMSQLSVETCLLVEIPHPC